MRLYVDGMNVIGTRPDGWWRDRHAAMVRLVDLLERWAATSGDDITVVFERRPDPPISSPVIEVAHAPRPQPDAADDEIVRRVRAESPRATVCVVTSDRWLADQVRAAGAVVEPADAFRSRIDAG
ncbi:MAG TPA: NYN domain-containing protein [Solirubrobacteraceae bacterium]|nr:NYN domain-containing protein [Solirubrobacteraceae bacterium]